MRLEKMDNGLIYFSAHKQLMNVFPGYDSGTEMNPINLYHCKCHVSREGFSNSRSLIIGAPNLRCATSAPLTKNLMAPHSRQGTLKSHSHIAWIWVLLTVVPILTYAGATVLLVLEALGGHRPSTLYDYKYGERPDNVHVVNVNWTVLGSPAREIFCTGNSRCELLIRDTEDPLRIQNDTLPRQALSDTERKIFHGLGEDGNWIRFIVHPVNCSPVSGAR